MHTLLGLRRILQIFRSYEAEAAFEIFPWIQRLERLVHWVTHLQKHMTRPAKTRHICITTEIHFLFVHASYSHALYRNTKYLTTDGPVYFHRRHFAVAVEPWGCISRPQGALIRCMGYQTGPKAVLAHPLDCISLCHLLKAQHCCLSPNGCFNPPLASHPPPSHLVAHPL